MASPRDAMHARSSHDRPPAIAITLASDASRDCAIDSAGARPYPMTHQ
jgi:hypothetical protein